MKYIALLRGINVGGNKKVSMAELKVLYESIACSEVKTLLNSGNVIFEHLKTSERDLVKKLETAFKKKLGFDSKVILRTAKEIEDIICINPFKDIKTDKSTRLYVTFLREKSTSTLKLPYISPDKDFHVIAKVNREVFSVLTIKSARSVQTMAFLRQEYGGDITTRSWNTVLKLSQ